MNKLGCRILEVTPKTSTLYTMPLEVYKIVAFVLDRRFVKNVARAIELLPEDFKKLVTIRVLPKTKDGVKGRKASLILIDEAAKL